MRAAGEAFVRYFQRRAWPFDGGWERWHPPHDWEIPQLPGDWQLDLGTHGLFRRRLKNAGEEE